MATDRPQPMPTLVWMEPHQIPLVEAVADRAGLRLVAAGAPPQSLRGRAGEGGRGPAGLEWFSDLRRALVNSEAKLVWLATSRGAEPGGVGSEAPPLDVGELGAILRERRLVGISLEPPAAPSAVALSELGESVRFVPLLADTRLFAGALDAIAAMGPPRSAVVRLESGAGAGSVAARLYDACHLLARVWGVPESIDASAVQPVSGAGLPLPLGEELLRLRGEVIAHARFAGGRAAALALSDRAGRWRRELVLLGEGGRLALTDAGFERTDPSGALVDSSRTVAGAPAPRGGAGGLFEADAGAVEAIAGPIADLLDPHAPRPVPADRATVLAIAEAALLSARTGQPESPATVLRMLQGA